MLLANDLQVKTIATREAAPPAIQAEGVHTLQQRQKQTGRGDNSQTIAQESVPYETAHEMAHNKHINTLSTASANSSCAK